MSLPEYLSQEEVQTTTVVGLPACMGVRRWLLPGWLDEERHKK